MHGGDDTAPLNLRLDCDVLSKVRRRVERFGRDLYLRPWGNGDVAPSLNSSIRLLCEQVRAAERTSFVYGAVQQTHRGAMVLSRVWRFARGASSLCLAMPAVSAQPLAVCI